MSSYGVSLRSLGYRVNRLFHTAHASPAAFYTSCTPCTRGLGGRCDGPAWCGAVYAGLRFGSIAGVTSHFFAYLARMKFIQRWGLMRNTRPENTQEHSLQVAMIAHALAVIGNRKFGKDLDPNRTALLAVYHDAEEVITGDVPTPIKYFNPTIKEALFDIETVARTRLLAMLPEELQSDYNDLFFHEEQDAAAWRVVKQADKVSAYLKCIEESKAGNEEFQKAEQSILKELERDPDPALVYFLETFVPSFRLTLDELN